MSIIEKAIYDLLQTEPFFANFLLGSKVSFDTDGVPTLGAKVERGQVSFVINTEFFNQHNRKEQVGFIKHEVFHVLLEHCSVRGSKLNAKAKNYAMDCAINQHISDLPEGCVTLSTMEQMCKRKLGALEPWEYYYEAMRDQAKKNGKGDGDGKPSGSSIGIEDPNHDYMDSSDKSDAEDAINKAAVKDMASKALAASAGKVPEAIARILDTLNKKAQLPWSQILRNFVANARTTETKTTRNKPHRRFDLAQPGRKKLKKLVLGVCTDSSGSVSDESYAKFMSEIHNIAKHTTITYLVHADCVVQKVDVIKGGKPKPRVLTERHGGGGTAYGPAIAECQNKHCDAIIYFGDFDCADKPQNPGVPFLWVGVGNQDPPASFGKVLRLV